MRSSFVHTLMAGESDDALPVGCLSEGPYVSYERQRVTVPKGSKWLLVSVALHGIQLLKADKHGRTLRHDVLIDQHVVSARPNRLIRIPAVRGALDMVSSGVGAIDLVPRRYGDWGLMEGERNRRRLLHALEVLIGITSGLHDDLNEALSWRGSTGTTICAGARRMLPPGCVMIRALLAEPWPRMLR